MPYHDLVALWEAHCRYEFETRDVDATMATMVAEPHVNHAPTPIGVGHNQLKRFYRSHFIGGNPPDAELAPISRTVGAEQIVDEMLFKFTHIHLRRVGLNDQQKRISGAAFHSIPISSKRNSNP